MSQHPCRPAAAPATASSRSSSSWQHRPSLLLESTGEGIYGLDLQGRCVFINRAGAAMLGYRPGELIGCNMHGVTHHSHADGTAYPEDDCAIFEAFRRNRPCRIDSEVFWRRDASAFAVEYSSCPVFDGGEIVGAVVTFVDITRRRLAEDALRQARDTLEQRVRERTRELSSALAQLRELSAWTERVREDERTRIAREVHDELGSMLVALKMEVTWLDKRLSEQEGRGAAGAHDMRARMRGKCRNMNRLIEDAVDNVGRIITDLRPSILDHQGLWAALEWQAQEFAQSAELRLDWRASVGEGVALPGDQAMAVFRIAQEMLSNVGRHAQAGSIAVRLAAGGGWLSLSVRDDGRGAPPRAFEAPTAYGIRGMRERARHWGGELSIRSAPGHGCRLALRMPLAAGADREAA